MRSSRTSTLWVSSPTGSAVSSSSCSASGPASVSLSSTNWISALTRRCLCPAALTSSTICLRSTPTCLQVNSIHLPVYILYPYLYILSTIYLPVYTLYYTLYILSAIHCIYFLLYTVYTLYYTLYTLSTIHCIHSLLYTVYTLCYTLYLTIHRSSAILCGEAGAGLQCPTAAEYGVWVRGLPLRLPGRSDLPGSRGTQRVSQYTYFTLYYILYTNIHTILYTLYCIHYTVYTILIYYTLYYILIYTLYRIHYTVYTYL